MDALGSISHLDYFIFTYTFTSTELVNRKVSLIARCIVESSVVIKGIDPNTLHVIISRVFKVRDVPRSTLTAIHSQLMRAISEPVIRFSSLAARENEELEAWYKPGSQQKGFEPNGGFIVYRQNDAPDSGEIAD